MINGYNGVWAIDHDDGSQFFDDTRNLMLWGVALTLVTLTLVTLTLVTRMTVTATNLLRLYPHTCIHPHFHWTLGRDTS